MSTSEVFKFFYVRLVKRLPMDDTLFRAELFGADLLPGNLKETVESKPTKSDKAAYFLDHVIKPNVICDDSSSFDKLLDVMEDSEYPDMQKLAELIRIKLRNRPSNSDSGTESATTYLSELTTKRMRSCSPLDVSRLKARYVKLLPTSKTDWPKHKVTQYIRLALVEKEDVTLRDKYLNDLTRLTLQGEIDKILKRKEPLGDLKDIFHYNNEPCPRLILIMGGPGIGKTTLSHELCLRWARDGFLTEDFDVVILIPLRTVQQRSLEEVMVEHTGKNNYEQLMRSAGCRCLIILEGFDELGVKCRQSDPFLMRLIREYTTLEEATILITSRPHACDEINAGRRIEVVGFGRDEIREFAEKSFPNDIQSVEEFLWQLDEYPQLYSLCYIPMNLVMLADIFHCSEKKLPSTLTELYHLFIAMTLKRQIEKNVSKQPAVCKSVAVRTADGAEEILGIMLRGIPKETVGIVLRLSRLAYRGFFDWYCHRESGSRWRKDWKEPKIIFTQSDLIRCDIEVTNDFDGFGLLKATYIHELLTDINTYSFNHLTIQEYLCAVYISLQSQQEQLHLMTEHFHEYPNIFSFVCGLTGLISDEMFQFIYSRLASLGEPLQGDINIITLMRCFNESKKKSYDCQHHSGLPFTLNIFGNTLLPYDCLCLSNILSCYPVSKLNMCGCHIGPKEVELLAKYYLSKNTVYQLPEELYLNGNDLTSEGMEHLMKIVSTGSATLRVLDVSQNSIGDDGMAVTSGVLQHSKSLTKLGVVDCALSVKGAISISQILMVNHSLQELYICYNNISDDGISAIAEALAVGNCRINVLDVSMCGITLNGAISLAAVLSSNYTIRVLMLMMNAITAEGAALIAKSAVDNIACHCVGINNEYQNDEIKKIMKILEDRRIQHELLLQPQVTESIVEKNSNSRDKDELTIITEDGVTVDTEMWLMNKGEDSHSDEQEDTIGLRSDKCNIKKNLDHHYH